MKKLKIVHLYPEEMNIYGDMGNRLVLEKRLKWRSIPYEVINVGIGGEIPKDAGIIIGGGGQDSGQSKVEKDLLDKGPILKELAEQGVVMLMICGLYQLFGRSFITKEGKTIKGIGILPIFTQASDTRLIGNIVVDSRFGRLVGYENHSGQTFLEEGCAPLGKVRKGAGNNAKQKTEGAVFKNVFGSYMHGPLLSKNPHLADYLISLAIGVKLTTLDDNLEHRAQQLAARRPR